jgi:tRNA(Ile)-lysidine synthase
MPTVLDPVRGEKGGPAATLQITELENLSPAVLNRVIRRSALDVFGVSLSAAHTAAITRLVTDWHGQGEAHLPGIRVERQGGQLLLTTPFNAHN